MPEKADQLGQAVLERAVDAARDLWRDRLLAAYALGSLAHGGFSRLVSDVDAGFVLEGPLIQTDKDTVSALGDRVKGSGLPLADRLSAFWGPRDCLDAGRFPAIDRADLLQYGRLLYGQDVRDGLSMPTQQELALQGAMAGLGLLERDAYKAALADPASLLRGDLKPLTKTILFPVRFLYTLRTGEIGRNHDAVNHFVETERGPAADLAAAALIWRDAPPAQDDAAAAALLNAGLRPIWELFLQDHLGRLQAFAPSDLLDRLRSARILSP